MHRERNKNTFENVLYLNAFYDANAHSSFLECAFFAFFFSFYIPVSDLYVSRSECKRFQKIRKTYKLSDNSQYNSTKYGYVAIK